jgi:hypothetical protein
MKAQCAVNEAPDKGGMSSAAFAVNVGLEMFVTFVFSKAIW